MVFWLLFTMFEMGTEKKLGHSVLAAVHHV